MRLNSCKMETVHRVTGAQKLTFLLFIEFFKVIEIGRVRHVLHIHWNGSWAVPMGKSHDDHMIYVKHHMIITILHLI